MVTCFGDKRAGGLADYARDIINIYVAISTRKKDECTFYNIVRPTYNEFGYSEITVITSKCLLHAFAAILLM